MALNLEVILKFWAILMCLLYCRNIVPLHGNPEDYAWGAGGLDAIITQVRGVMVVCTWLVCLLSPVKRLDSAAVVIIKVLTIT